MRRRVAAIVVGMMVGCGSVALAQPVATADPERKVEFVISDDRITESSGLATDPVNRVYWTINDSDDRGMVYALNKRGATVGTLRYAADPVDVESIAYSNARLYVGDTGGNREKRTVITVYEFTEPRPDDSEQSYRTLQFSYPDGPHDTEAMLVDSRGRFTFVSKGSEGGEIFTASQDVSTSEPNPLTRVERAPQYVTDGTVLADGRMILRSYVAVFQLDPESYEIVASAATPPLKQGESVTAPLTGAGLLVGTEGKQSEVLRVPVPTTIGRVPTITASATASPSGSPVASPPAEPPQTSEAPMVLIYSGAAVVAAAGAAVALVLRRRSRRQ